VFPFCTATLWGPRPRGNAQGKSRTFPRLIWERNEEAQVEVSKLDLNLLLVFCAVMRKRSATLAGEELDMTQSAVSNALRRLRLFFGDPLFVKGSQGMAPTALAERLAGPLQDALDRIRSTVEGAVPFNPALSDRTFRIYMSDLGQMILMPRLVKALAQAAPGIRLAVVDVPPRTAQNMMSEGAIDLAIGTFAAFEAGFHSQRLFSKSYMVLGRKGHPAFAPQLTLAAFLAAAHGVYHPPAGSHDDFEEVLSRVFAAHGVKRKVALELAHGLGLGETVAASDVLLCAPKRLADFLVDTGLVAAAPLPFESPRIDVSQFWHERNHMDDGHRWMRSLVYRNHAAT
jgi:DNA-binding transcriptional LysR family regulator